MPPREGPDIESSSGRRVNNECTVDVSNNHFERLVFSKDYSIPGRKTYVHFLFRVILDENFLNLNASKIHSDTMKECLISLRLKFRCDS